MLLGLGSSVIACGGAGGATPQASAAQTSTSNRGSESTTPDGLPTSVVTVDVSGAADCGALAHAITPMLDSLGDLSAEEANQLAQSVISQIGQQLDAIETRRVALDCDAAVWKVARCDALTDSKGSLAEQMFQQFCAAPAVAAPPTTTSGSAGTG